MPADAIQPSWRFLPGQHVACALRKRPDHHEDCANDQRAQDKTKEAPKRMHRRRTSRQVDWRMRSGRRRWDRHRWRWWPRDIWHESIRRPVIGQPSTLSHDGHTSSALRFIGYLMRNHLIMMLNLASETSGASSPDSSSSGVPVAAAGLGSAGGVLCWSLAG